MPIGNHDLSDTAASPLSQFRLQRRAGAGSVHDLSAGLGESVAFAVVARRYSFSARNRISRGAKNPE